MLLSMLPTLLTLSSPKPSPPPPTPPPPLPWSGEVPPFYFLYTSPQNKFLMHVFQWRHENYFLVPFELCHEFHIRCLWFFKILFVQRKLQFIRKKFDNVRFCERPLCELQTFTALNAIDICNNLYLELWHRNGNLSAPLHSFFPRGG